MKHLKEFITEARSKKVQCLYGDLMKAQLGYMDERVNGSWEKYFKGEYESVLEANNAFEPAFKNADYAWHYVKEHEQDMVNTTAKWDDDWECWMFSVTFNDDVTTNFCMDPLPR